MSGAVSRKGLEFTSTETTFTVSLHGRKILDHSPDSPCIELGTGVQKVESHSGFFKIREQQVSLAPMTSFTVVSVAKKRIQLSFSHKVTVTIEENDGRAILSFDAQRSPDDRFKLSIPALGDERVYGGGEQLGRLNLRGKKLPVWISEPGVGRRFDLLTIGFALKTGHIPRWYNTYYSMPVWSTSKGLYCWSESTAYTELDFTNRSRHSIYIWEIPKQIMIGAEEDSIGAVAGLSAYIGRQPKLPSWVYDGMWLGLQGGSVVTEQVLKKAEACKVPITAIWCQDWEGRRKTKFGSQLRWAWEWDNNLYPDLPSYISSLKKRGIRFLAYNNTFLTPGSSMFDEAVQKGYLVKKSDGSPYFVDVPFDPAGMVDFTNPEAVAWLKAIIKKNMLDIGISGWMADFGEMIPHDAQLYSEVNGLTYHNQYPVDWARLNYDVIHEAGLEDEIIYFMRAGFAGGAPFTSMNWNGDQLVDWSYEDGLPSAIMGSLTLGMSGVGYTHSDIGGYTTLGYKKRPKELLMRWAEYSAFTQTMRSHEGNRPQNNVQFADDDEAMTHLGVMVRVFNHLKPYHEALSDEYQKSGLPPMRMVQLHYPDEIKKLEVYRYQYLYGRDLLVAPVIKPGKNRWKVYLPKDTWVHLWSGKTFTGGKEVIVEAPFGQPPVFYRKSSEFVKLFGELNI